MQIPALHATGGEAPARSAAAATWTRNGVVISCTDPGVPLASRNGIAATGDSTQSIFGSPDASRTTRSLSGDVPRFLTLT